MTRPSAQSAMRREPPGRPEAGPLPADEAGLVERARAGSREAAERLAAESYGMLFASCCAAAMSAQRSSQRWKSPIAR